MSYMPTISTVLLGDPPPGRSALDGWVQKGEGTGREYGDRW